MSLFKLMLTKQPLWRSLSLTITGIRHGHDPVHGRKLQHKTVKTEEWHVVALRECEAQQTGDLQLEASCWIEAVERANGK